MSRIIEPTRTERAAGMELLQRAFEEDLHWPGRDGRSGDLTREVTFGHTRGAEIVAREAGVVCGLAIARAAFELQGIEHIHLFAHDGEQVAAGSVLATVAGSADAILVAERAALNIVQRLSGTATSTRAYVDAIDGTSASILDTRKTIPGMRALQRWAVRCGGGMNHRFGLYDEAMLKDNHIAVAGGITQAVATVRAAHPERRLHVETASLEQVAEALDAGVDVIMLDNMSIEAMVEAVALVGGRCEVEASGGITLDTVRSVAETGVDRISVGAITHSAPALDVALDVRG